MIELVTLFPPVEAWASADIWMSLLMLTFMEIILGIDNIIFISIAANKLPEHQQAKARNIGLVLAMVFRVILLFGISYLVAMNKALFYIGTEDSFIHGGFSGQSLILIIGGFFLLYKSTTEIHHKLEGGPNGTDESATEDGKQTTRASKKLKKASLNNIILQICLINIVFSFDSILTAVGLADYIIVMIVAVVVSVLIMMIFAAPVGNFVNENPTIQMLALAFLILIGFMLITEGAHLAHFEIANQPVGAVPKGYLYFAIFFSLAVEFLNMRMFKKGKQRVKLNSYTQEAAEDGML